MKVCCRTLNLRGFGGASLISGRSNGSVSSRGGFSDIRALPQTILRSRNRAQRPQRHFVVVHSKLIELLIPCGILGKETLNSRNVPVVMVLPDRAHLGV